MGINYTQIVILSIILSLSNVIMVYSQNGKSPRTYIEKHKPTFWLGARGGIGITQVVTSTRYHVFSSNQTIVDKDYSADDLGFQLGLMLGVEYYRNISFEVYPSYNVYNYSYTSGFSWKNTSNILALSYLHENRFKYLELPLVLKLDLFKGRMKTALASIPAYQKQRIVFPYVLLGATYARLIKAEKVISASGIETATGSINNDLNDANTETNITDQYRDNNISLFGGAGIAYMVGPSRVSLEINVLYGLNILTRGDKRYKDLNTAVNTFDVPDDIKLNNLSVVLQYAIPLNLN